MLICITFDSINRTKSKPTTGVGIKRSFVSFFLSCYSASYRSLTSLVTFPFGEKMMNVQWEPRGCWYSLLRRTFFCLSFSLFICFSYFYITSPASFYQEWWQHDQEYHHDRLCYQSTMTCQWPCRVMQTPPSRRHAVRSGGDASGDAFHALWWLTRFDFLIYTFYFAYFADADAMIRVGWFGYVFGRRKLRVGNDWSGLKGSW